MIGKRCRGKDAFMPIILITSVALVTLNSENNEINYWPTIQLSTTE